MNKIYILLQILLLAFALVFVSTRAAWSDVITEEKLILTPDGVEAALCTANYDEFIKITCHTDKWECTVYPETGSSRCKERKHD